MEGHISKEQTEKIPAGIRDLLDVLSETIGGDPVVTFTDGTYEIEADHFTLSYTVNDTVFEIRNIDVRDNPGLGHQIIDAIHEYTDENDLTVIASTVRDSARGFWEKMGYQAGEVDGEFFRVE